MKPLTAADVLQPRDAHGRFVKATAPNLPDSLLANGLPVLDDGTTPIYFALIAERTEVGR